MRSKDLLKGMTVEEILNLDMRTLNQQQIRAASSRLASAANKRIGRLAEKGLYTKATERALKGGGRFSVRGKDAKEVREEYRRARSFLKSKQSTVKGAAKTVEALAQKDANKMKDAELRKHAAKVGSAVNKRIKRMLKAGETSPAMRGFFKAGGFEGSDISIDDFEKYKFSIRGMTTNEVRSELKRARDFLQAGTSTLGEWREVRAETMGTLKERGIEMDDGQWDVFWKSYERLKEIDPSVANLQFKYRVLTEVQKVVEADPTKDAKDIAVEMAGRLNDIYEEQARLNDSGGVSRFIKPR